MQNCHLLARWSRPHWRLLCYHAIPDSCAANFCKQLVTFRELGFSFVSLDRGLHLCQEEGFTRPTITLTFDDGALTVYRNALPVLQELGVEGFLYLTVDYVKRGTTYRDESPLPAMTWDHVHDWLRLGHGVGSHTLTHVPLSLCSDARLVQECAFSKQALEQELQVPICHFAYPFGAHSRRTQRLICAGRFYGSAATIDRGRMWVGHDPYRLRRDPCDPGTPVPSLVRVMRLADRWYWLKGPRRLLSKGCRQMHHDWEQRRWAGEWEALSERGDTPGLSARDSLSQ